MSLIKLSRNTVTVSTCKAILSQIIIKWCLFKSHHLALVKEEMSEYKPNFKIHLLENTNVQINIKHSTGFIAIAMNWEPLKIVQLQSFREYF